MVDLVSLQWFGDENMTKFRYTWDSCVQSMYPPLPDDTLRDILYKKLAPSKVLREDLCHFDRQEQGHPHRTYAWLRGRIDYHIIRQLQENNQAEKTSMCRGKQGAPLDPSVAPAKANVSLVRLRSFHTASGSQLLSHKVTDCAVLRSCCIKYFFTV